MTSTNELPTAPRVWVISLGGGGRHFDDCVKEELIGIGWEKLGDLRQYSDKETVLEALARTSDGKENSRNNAKTNYDFAHTMQKGDFVVAKVGRSKVLGLARITSNYVYDAAHMPLVHYRKVSWLGLKEIDLPNEARVALKTLTLVSPRKNERFLRLISDAFNVDLLLDTEESGVDDDDQLQSLRDAWTQYQTNPINQLHLAVRKLRAEQLRQFMGTPERVNVDSFTREVWLLEKQTLLDGEDITGEIWSGDLSEDRAEELHAALDAERIKFHGNMIWGTGSRTFWPVAQDKSERSQSVARAVEIANRSDLTGYEKAMQIWDVKGFGENSATGIAMVMHPEDVAIYNAPSKEALQKLSIKWSGPEEFQTRIAELRDELAIDDFIQLDYLLYWWLKKTPAQRPVQYWWLNQGRNYESERELSVLYAPLESKSGRRPPHWARVDNVMPGDIIYHYSEQSIRAVSVATASAVNAPRPTGAAREDEYPEGSLVRTEYHELSEPIALEEIPHDWRTREGGPFNRHGAINQGYLYKISKQFADQVARKFAERLPTIIAPPPDVSHIWLFQANPKIWSPTEHLESLKTMTSDEWAVTRYASDIAVNDTVLIWESGADAGLVAIAEIVDLPSLRSVPQDMRDRRGTGDTETRVGIRYTRFLEPKIGKEQLADHPVLSELQVLRSPQGTNFAVTQTQWRAIQSLIGHIEPPSYQEPSFASITASIAHAGLRIAPEVLRRYHLSLKTRGFVVLTGISGTGKTRLAEDYARAVNAERIVVPVAPNWNSNEDLLGFYNPLDNQYAHTEFSRFLVRAAREFDRAQQANVPARPYHLILDEMNLARVEHYFAKFLSAMERRHGSAEPTIDLGGDQTVPLPPNLKFIGTVNVDETTHTFADKVYDRAQMIELTIGETAVRTHVGQTPYAATLLELWQVCRPCAPFAFRVLDEIASYIREAEAIDVSWQEALDDQVLQKVLPKFNGSNASLGGALDALIVLLDGKCLESHAKAQKMHAGFMEYGFVSYF